MRKAICDYCKAEGSITPNNSNALPEGWHTLNIQLDYGSRIEKLLCADCGELHGIPERRFSPSTPMDRLAELVHELVEDSLNDLAPER